MTMNIRRTALAAALAASALLSGAAVADAQTGSMGRDMYGSTGMVGSGEASGEDAAAFADWNSRIAPDWERYRVQLRRQFPKLSEADLAATDGERAEVVALIQDRYRLSNERAHERLLQWQRRADLANRR